MSICWKVFDQEIKIRVIKNKFYTVCSCYVFVIIYKLLMCPYIHARYKRQPL